MEALWFLLIPFLGTTLGSMMVFFLKDKMNPRVEHILIGFAAGVMVAASIWSLIVPAIEMSSDMGSLSFIPSSVGFLLGVFFLLLLDTFIPHLHLKSNTPEGKANKKISKTLMMVFAITLHNIPEGMAVGIVFAGMLFGSSNITLLGALSLAIGIAIQNFPEGAIVSMPLKSEGNTKMKSFWLGTLSGAVEPIAAIITILFANFFIPILPYLLSFAAGAMMYVVVEELIPESQSGKHSNLATIGFSVGFVLMMILDVALG